MIFRSIIKNRHDRPTIMRGILFIFLLLLTNTFAQNVKFDKGALNVSGDELSEHIPFDNLIGYFEFENEMVTRVGDQSQFVITNLDSISDQTPSTDSLSARALFYSKKETHYEPFSISFFIYHTAIHNNKVQIITDQKSASTQWAIYKEGQTLNAYFKDPYSTNVQTIQDIDFEYRWLHVVVTFKGTTSKDGIAMYINGKLASTPLDVRENNVVDDDFTNPTADIQLDALAIWDKTLSKTEIDAIYTWQKTQYQLKHDEIHNRLNVKFYPPQIDLTKGNYWSVYEVPLTTPTYLEPFLNEENIWTTRISDGHNRAFENIGDNVRIRHAYSRRGAWNIDSRYIRLAGNKGFLLDGKTYKVLGRTNMPLIWSNVNPLKAYGSYHNIFYWRILNEKTYQGDYHDYVFTDYETMNMPTSETNIDNNDKYVALYGKKSGSSTVWVVVFDIENKIIVSEKSLDVDYSDVDWISISQDGNYVVVLFNVNGNKPNQGVKVYDRDLNFLRHLSDQRAHADLGVDAYGNQVLIMFYNSKTHNLAALRLDGGGIMPLMPKLGTFLDKGVPGGHISARNIKRPGWAYVSLGQSKSGPNSWMPSLMVFSLKLDGSDTAEIWGKTFASNHGVNYGQEVQCVPSADGKKVMFASDFNDDNLKAQSYSPSWIFQLEKPLVQTEPH